MKSFFVCLIVLILISPTSSFAQLDSTTIITEEVLDNILTEPGEESDAEELVEYVEDLINNPVDLNTADVFELSKLPNMNSQAAQIIIEHRIKFGYFYSPNELFAIRDLDKQLIEGILHFIKTSEQKITTEETEPDYDYKGPVITKSKFKIRSRATSDLQNRAGFENSKFLGSKLKSYNKFLFNYDKNFQAGFLIEKDAGETSFSDFSSFHLQYRDDGLIKNIIAGDYMLEFGQGLALWSPFGFSKGADAVFPVKKKARYLRPYTSAAEFRFYRGAASTFAFNDFNVTAFYSNNTFDASIDSVTGEIISVGQTGYHRTESEWNKKNSAKQQLFGGVIDYKYNGKLNLGLIYYNVSFDKYFTSKSLYDLSGKSFNYTSAYYEINFSKINFFGEASFDGTTVASINGIQFSADQYFIFTTSVRNYPRNYNNLLGFGFSERSGKINNEIGLYSGFKWKTMIGVLNLYYDIFKFPYRTNTNSLSSEGDELLLDFVSMPFTDFETRLRYKYENKEVTSLVDNEDYIVMRLKQTARIEFIYYLAKNLNLKTRVEYNHFFIKDAGIKENGFLFFQDVKYAVNKNLNLAGRIIFYHTDSFSSAVYEYENDLFGVMPNLAMYGKGIRWYMIIKYKPLSFITLSAKYSETYKPEVTFLSSGDNKINGNLDNRFSMQIDLSF